MNDVLGQAIHDYYHKRTQSKLWIHNKYGPKEEMPIHVYFRNADRMPDLELIAMENCKGKILDIGAGAGAHILLLQQNNKGVTALEISLKSAAVMKLRGDKNIIVQDIFTFENDRFDTLLLLMNGIGLTANVNGLRQFLQHAKKLLLPGGHLLFDSSDVAYLYEGNIPELDNYYGEIMYQYEYKKQRTDWFSWLYIDHKKLTNTANEEGWETEILFKDQYDQYLAKLVLRQ